MKTIIFGAFALAFAVPRAAQSVPPVHPSLNAQGQHQHDPKAGGKEHADHEKHCKDMMAKMHKAMKHDGYDKSGDAKPSASSGSQDHSGPNFSKPRGGFAKIGEKAFLTISTIQRSD